MILNGCGNRLRAGEGTDGRLIGLAVNFSCSCIRPLSWETLVLLPPWIWAGHWRALANEMLASGSNQESWKRVSNIQRSISAPVTWPELDGCWRMESCGAEQRHASQVNQQSAYSQAALALAPQDNGGYGTDSAVHKRLSKPSQGQSSRSSESHWLLS